MHKATYNSGTSTADHTTLRWLSDTAASLWQHYRAWRRIRATADVLHGLSDHTLKDIGIDRSEIDSIARNPGRHNRR